MAVDPVIEAASICDCCEGISQETPQAVFNRPGLKAIAYRVGSHQQFKPSLLASLHTSHQRALDAFSARGDDDFTIALLDAVSAVADVLTFYTERIGNEAYLRTAAERRSVLELAQLIGYQLRPGVAASAWLAFTIDDSPGAFGTALIPSTTAQVVPEAPPTVTIDIGVKVQSVPGPNEQAQTFETVENIEARAEWNAMLPRPTQPQIVCTSAKRFVLAGAVSTLKKGDRILVAGADGSKLLSIVNVNIISDPASSDPMSATTLVDVGAVPDGDVGYSPSSYSPSPSSATGSVNDFPANTLLNANVVQQVISKQWDADTLLALARMQNWSLEQLSTDINQQIVKQNQNSSGQLYVLRQRAAVFGYNAPIWKSLPASLRYEGLFKVPGTTSSPKPKNIAVPAAYPSPGWDDRTLEDETTVSGNQRTIYLDNVYPEIIAGSWVVLLKPDGTNVIAKVISLREIAHAAFTLAAKVSLLTIEAPSAGLGNFKIRETVVLCQSEPLPLAPVPILDPVQDQTIVLDRAYLGLAKGRTVIISGERSDLNGVTDTEVRTLKEVAFQQGYTVITLDSSLDHSYKHLTVEINANVALSTHGESVQSILDPLSLTGQGPKGILGSGDGSQAFQKVVLQFSPLTYVSADTPTGTSSTLEVRVDDMLWKEVPFLYGHGPEERIYSTRQDDAGKTTVIFGDGVTGSRLSTGQQNLKAKYRKGIGLAGLVRANQLSQLMVRPAGVKAVNNPLPASGAADPENLEEARRNATLTIMTLDRVVSLEDYQDFARAFAGVEKAIATWTWSGEQRMVLLTVAGANGAAILPESPLYANLLKALTRFGEPSVSLKLYSYDPILFRLSGTVTAMPDQLLGKVQAGVESALRYAFSFSARDFGQPAHVSEVIAAIQNVPGVLAVDLDQMYRSDLAPGPLVDIPAAMPRPGKREMFAAQLLTLDSRPLDLKITI